MNSYALGTQGVKTVDDILVIISNPSIPNHMGYTLTGITIASEDETRLNQAGWVIRSRRMTTVGEAPMEIEWTYELVKSE